MAAASSVIEEAFTVRKMTGRIGAEIIGADMADGKQETADFIRMAAIRNRVVVVRDQHLSREDQLAFGRMIGPFVYTRSLVHNDDNPEIYVVKNPGKGGMPTNNWHTDATTSPKPPSLTMLAAQILPEVGGDTLFVDMVQAYERLSPGYKRMLRGLRLHHANRMPSPGNQPEWWHPMVRVIPETGERALYPGFPYIAEEIEGWTLAESKPIVDFLFTHAMYQDAIYRHRWLPGDVVIWDNRSTMHYAVHDYGDEDRILTRLMIEGEEPYDLPYDD